MLALFVDVVAFWHCLLLVYGIILWYLLVVGWLPWLLDKCYNICTVGWAYHHKDKIAKLLLLLHNLRQATLSL